MNNYNCGLTRLKDLVGPNWTRKCCSCGKVISFDDIRIIENGVHETGIWYEHDVDSCRSSMLEPWSNNETK